MFEFLSQPGVWLAIAQMVAIDIMLGGDNAVVIALACRNLPAHQRNRAIIAGALGAVLLRIVLIFFALQLLALPFLKLVGASLLLWIGVKLLVPEDEDHSGFAGSASLLTAIKTIIVADAVMSLDNVIAVAAASKGELGLVVFAIALSIPIIIWGSKIVLGLMERFPIVISICAALLGWIAGGMAVSDHVLPQTAPWVHHAVSASLALLVVVCGRALAARKAPKLPPEPLATEPN